MQLAFTRRSRGGLTFAANYTLAKGMSDVTQPGGGGAAAGLRRRSEPDPRARVEPERHRHPPPLRLLAQLRAAVRPRRHRRAPLSHRRLAGEPPGLLAERPAVHRVQRHRAQQHRRRPGPPEPDLLGRARRPDRRPVVRHVVLRRPGDQHHRQLRPQQPLRAAAAARSTCRCSRTSCSARSRLQLRLEVFNVTNTPSFARAGRRPRLGHLRPDHLDRQQHPAAVPVRREVPVLTGQGLGLAGVADRAARERGSPGRS